MRWHGNQRSFSPDQGLLVLLGDATGHGVAPALSVAQTHAMLRMALRLGADLESAHRQVNDQFAVTLPDDHFVTTFIELLETKPHRLRSHRAAGSCPSLKRNTGRSPPPVQR